MRAIYKYPLLSTGANIIDIPDGWKPLHVGMQLGTPCVWAQIETEQPKRKRTLWVVGTGWSLPDTCCSNCFLGTAHTDDSLVWHVFDGGLSETVSGERP